MIRFHVRDEEVGETIIEIGQTLTGPGVNGKGVRERSNGKL